MPIELKDLRWAIIATQHRSLRQAAERLNIRQSTLSRRLRSMEAMLGVQLFERTNGGTRPTIEGLEFLEAARGIIEETVDHGPPQEPSPGRERTAYHRCSRLALCWQSPRYTDRVSQALSRCGGALGRRIERPIDLRSFEFCHRHRICGRRKSSLGWKVTARLGRTRR